MSILSNGCHCVFGVGVGDVPFISPQQITKETTHYSLANGQLPREKAWGWSLQVSQHLLPKHLLESHHCTAGLARFLDCCASRMTKQMVVGVAQLSCQVGGGAGATPAQR
ncbi:unnamed protein product [Linum trigynum]|uniref:Uncharacterized protein n=1 Tax=Linum trigynum TaxID=586398 RepID=A0AAV2CL37_9ROSI